MKTEEKETIDVGGEETEPIDLVLFQVSECYVYLIPPRKSSASYRADEWNVNKWAWEGMLNVVSRGEECIIRLEDKITGEIYARAFLRQGNPHPVEPVIDSSRYFVLRIEENIGGRHRHAFIGIGFRERAQAYDFQAALHDHMKYLDKKKTAEEMEQHFQTTSSVDYSLKEGQTLVLQIKDKSGRGAVKSKFFEQGLNSLSLEEKIEHKEPILGIKPPPPPPASLPPMNNSQISLPKFSLDGTAGKNKASIANEDLKQRHSPQTEITQDNPDDDFGDFQAAG